jgi:hypothetical protein
VFEDFDRADEIGPKGRRPAGEYRRDQTGYSPP